jgi:hypothetical protein
MHNKANKHVLSLAILNCTFVLAREKASVENSSDSRSFFRGSQVLDYMQ